MQDLSRITATEAVKLIRDGHIEPMEIMEACLDRIDQREGERHAMVHFAAEAASRAASRPRPGPLAGLPIGVKDVLDTADMPSQ